MSFRVTIRTQENPNHFRHWMLKCLNSNFVDEVLICSGFFQEIPTGYSLSKDFDFINALSNIRNIKLLGVYNNLWKPRFRLFLFLLRMRLPLPPTRIKGFFIKRLKWHAKVFIGYRNKVPVFAIVGSSNMTNPAFAFLPGKNKFNHEADVIFWDPSDKALDNYFSSNEPTLDQPHDIITLDYDSEKNGKLSIADRLSNLNNLMRNLMESSVEI